MRTLLGAVLGLAIVAGGAYGQDKKDDQKGDKKGADPLLGLPSTADFKAKIGWDDDQCKKGDQVYIDYKDKVGDAQKRKEGGEKAANKDLKNLKTEITGKLRDICKDDDQKKKFDDLVPKKKKKNANQ